MTLTVYWLLSAHIIATKLPTNDNLHLADKRMSEVSKLRYLQPRRHHQERATLIREVL